MILIRDLESFSRIFDLLKVEFVIFVWGYTDSIQQKICKSSKFLKNSLKCTSVTFESFLITQFSIGHNRESVKILAINFMNYAMKSEYQYRFT